MRQALRRTSHAGWTIALFASFLLSCNTAPEDASLITAPSVSSLSSEDLDGAALFVGNLVPGVPAGNGVLR